MQRFIPPSNWMGKHELPCEYRRTLPSHKQLFLNLNLHFAFANNCLHLSKQLFAFITYKVTWLTLLSFETGPTGHDGGIEKSRHKQKHLDLIDAHLDMISLATSTCQRMCAHLVVTYRMRRD